MTQRTYFRGTQVRWNSQKRACGVRHIWSVHVRGLVRVLEAPTGRQMACRSFTVCTSSPAAPARRSPRGNITITTDRCPGQLSRWFVGKSPHVPGSARGVRLSLGLDGWRPHVGPAFRLSRYQHRPVWVSRTNTVVKFRSRFVFSSIWYRPCVAGGAAAGGCATAGRPRSQPRPRHRTKAPPTASDRVACFVTTSSLD